MPAILRATDAPELEQFTIAEPAVQSSPVALLAALHAEAADTARLANLLGRSLHATIAFPLMAAAVLALGGAGIARDAAWCVFVAAIVGAIAFAYRHTISQPFERAALKSFSQDLNAILLFAGFAWGSGAFLAIPASAATAVPAAFALLPVIAVAVLLREREPIFLFLAPVVTLTSFACVLRPLPGGALAAALVLLGCGAVAAATYFVGRRPAENQNLLELASLPFA